jgi:hypothetical protein
MCEQIDPGTAPKSQLNVIPHIATRNNIQLPIDIKEIFKFGCPNSNTTIMGFSLVVRFIINQSTRKTKNPAKNL